jgi:hypothetical protein
MVDLAKSYKRIENFVNHLNIPELSKEAEADIVYTAWEQDNIKIICNKWWINFHRGSQTVIWYVCFTANHVQHIFEAYSETELIRKLVRNKIWAILWGGEYVLNVCYKPDDGITWLKPEEILYVENNYDKIIKLFKKNGLEIGENDDEKHEHDVKTCNNPLNNQKNEDTNRETDIEESACIQHKEP